MRSLFQSKSIIYGGILLALLLLLGSLAGVGMLTRGGARNLRIGPETTYLSEPRDGRGGIDYLAATNAAAARGVLPANNAAIPLLEAFGPKCVEAELLPQCYGQLGIKPLPSDGSYYVGLVPYLKAQTRFRLSDLPSSVLPPGIEAGDDAGPGRAEESEMIAATRVLVEKLQEEVLEQSFSCRQRPWTSDEFPLIAAWLKANSKTLEKIGEASQRTAYFMPMLTRSDDDLLQSAQLAMTTETREAVHLLQTRAMWHVGAGRFDAAADDLLSGLRLAAIKGQGSSLIEVLVGYACEAIALGGIENLLATPGLEATTIQRMRAEFDTLPAMRGMWESFEREERYSYLSVCQYLAREGFSSAGELFGDGFSPSQFLFSQGVDWNLVMAAGNQYFDQLVEVGKLEDRHARLLACRDVVTRLEAAASQSSGLTSGARRLLTTTGRSELASASLLAMMMPAAGAVYRAEVRRETRKALARTALGVAAYRAEHGQLPKRLEQLVPEYNPNVPIDAYRGLPVLFRPIDTGFVVYSVGENGVDEHGFVSDNDPNQEGDLVFRVGQPLTQPETQRND